MRRGVLGLGVIALAVLAIILWRARGDEQTPSNAKLTEATPATHATGPQRAQRGPTWFAPLGISGRRIAGVVLTEDGAPVRGASVRLASEVSIAGMVPELRLVTDDNGRFDAGTQPALNYLISAEAPGLTAALEWVYASAPNARPPVDQLRLVLHPCVASIHGTIFDTAGGVVPGARISRLEGDIATSGGVEADARGAYELCVPPGGAAIAVTADGYATHTGQVNVFGRTRRDIELVPGATVVGRVVRAADQTPVAGAQVVLRTRDRAGTVLRATTNDEGRFEIDGAVTGRHHVTATADGLASAEPVEVTAEVGAPSDEVVCPLVAAYSVAGKVVEKESGKPVVGVSVRLLSMTNGNATTMPWAVAQSDGSFVMERVLPGTYQLVSMDAWREDQPPRQVTVAAADVADVVIEVARGGTVAGRVLHEGKPVSGVWVRLDGSPFRATTDHEGRFTIDHVAAGEYQLYAESHRHGAFTRSKPVIVAAGETQNIDLTLDLAGSIEGVVVDQNGAPVPSVFLRFSLLGGADFGAATTAEDGTFAARALSGGGSYVFEVRLHDGSAMVFAPASGKRFPAVPVADGTTHVKDLRVAIRYERMSIAGIVLDAEGNPQADVLVRAERSENRYAHAASTTTDARGAFTLRDVPAGTYTVIARSVRGEVREEKVEAGRTGVVLRMRAFSEIDGVLVGFTSSPRVVARLEGGVGYAARVTGTTFKIRDVPPGTYEIIAISDTEIGIVRTTTTGARTSVTLAKQPTGIIEGTVRDDNGGVPRDDVHCRSQLRGGDRRSLLSYTNAYEPAVDGRFRLERAQPGVHDVTCTSLTAHATASVTVVAGQRAQVNLTTTTQPTRQSATAGMQLEQKLGDIRVQSVVAGGPAAKAGVAVGDAVIKLDDKSVEDWESWRAEMELENKRVGDTIKVVLEREDKQLTVSIVLEAEQP
jgi:5-hydroxyisourate hydrolase-like protein (transthyretin family)